MRPNSLLLLVPGVGHCHWELQHPLGETCSPPGCLPPAGLAYVWLDHVPGTTLDNWTRFLNRRFLVNVHPLMQVKRAREAGPASAEKSSAEKSRARKTEQERAKARKARKEEDPLPEADQKIKAN